MSGNFVIVTDDQKFRRHSLYTHTNTNFLTVVILIKLFPADFHPFFMSHVLFTRPTSKISLLSWVFKGALLAILKTEATILDKTAEKMSHSQTLFPNILAVQRPPFPPPLGSNVVVCSKATLILKHL